MLRARLRYAGSDMGGEGPWMLTGNLYLDILLIHPPLYGAPLLEPTFHRRFEMINPRTRQATKHEPLFAGEKMPDSLRASAAGPVLRTVRQ
jgi:hypothetical protein